MKDLRERTDREERHAAKAIGGLDDLIKAVLASLPLIKPWQRQLRQYLLNIDRRVQVLRMTLSMGRSIEEVNEAVDQLRGGLRVAQRYLAVGRADLTTKAALAFACELGQRIATSLALQADEGPGA